jgi:hypothetical protein
MDAVLKIEYIKDFVDIGLGFWRTFDWEILRRCDTKISFITCLDMAAMVGFIRILRSNATATRCPIEKCSF